ncbi:hypothetical protein BEV13_01360 [Rickettsiella grylli]|uniref:hypothetical protein n=1 Tax=Rickettsiella grylli TaxID=59196 RepID=UPI0008FCF60E|nr:hypothetical protein [Rickettsiella grylli]OJA00998.1 hypothetical protein BEV13_01360 [Rickettsiella grylli]
MRYRMLDVRIWCDKKFRSLTPLKPSGQALFLYLLSNPHTTSIPGLYRAGPGAMAEELAWPLKGFQRALKEVIEQGLVKADPKARVIFIPNAIKYNKPQSPNVIRSWGGHWDEIPECALKNEAYNKLESSVRDLGKAFALAFMETLNHYKVNTSRDAYENTCPNQDQKQEHDKEQEHEEKAAFNDPLETFNPITRPCSSNIPHSEILLTIPLNDNAAYPITRQELLEWQHIYSNIDVLKELRKLIVWNTANPDKRKQRDRILQHIHTWLAREQDRLKHFTIGRSFPLTFEHNVRIAKKWLTPFSVCEESFDHQKNFPVLKGKKER